MRFLLLSISVLSAAGCGPPKAGDGCNTGGFLCADGANALECKEGKWVSLPCKGVGGCQRTSEMVRCDMTGNQEGDNCSSSAERKGLCTQDGRATLECKDGKLLKTNTCRACTVSGEIVVCQP